MPVWGNRSCRLVLAAALALAHGTAAFAQSPELVSHSDFRVCADPANDPMSTEDGTGFENKIAEVFAQALDKDLEYTWFPMSTGFIRNTLQANKCDVVIGYAQGHELVLNTNHYMTSVYTFITPADSPIADVAELSDPRLQGLHIGIVAGSPPATHLARNGLIQQAKGYPLFVDRRHYSPAADMLRDLASGEIDAAILWGPLGGPLAKRDHPDFIVTPLIHETLPPRLFYRITMGVRRSDDVWKRQLNSLIRRNQDQIDAILRDAGVPLLTDMGHEVKPVSQ